MPLTIRPAIRTDLPVIVAMLADDALGATREEATVPLPPAYADAFDAIEADANQLLLLADEDGDVSGVLQLTFIPGLTYVGGWRAQIEGVRVASAGRGQGVGRALVAHAVDLAQERGCRLIQLTTDRTRPDALRFYEELGFVATHVGLKRLL